MTKRSIAEIEAVTGSDQIRSRPCPSCYLCHGAGTLLYQNLTDRLFGTPGIWSFRLCTNPSCGLIWLDPMPLESDIGKAYENYYTHAPQPTQRSLIEQVKAVLTSAYQFGLRFTPVHSEYQDLELMYLGGLKPGRVLEIGCGDGTRLAGLRARGWDVQGQEVDENAAAWAQTNLGLRVFCGPIEQAGFRDQEFDAVVMNHVIEHVHDPIELLRKSKRILKPGGQLVSITPNTKGWGRAQFGADWIGMDRPRHLFLFSRNTLEEIARSCDLREVRTWTTAARSLIIVRATLRTQRGEPIRKAWPLIGRAVRQTILHAQSVMARRRDPDAGDECVLSAKA